MLLSLDNFSFIFFGLFLIWLIILSILFYRLAAHYQKLTKGITKKDLKSVLESLLKGFDEESKKVEELAKKTEKLKRDGLSHIQKIGLVRFNPFAETGGDQSFSLAALDEKDSGFVISSLHSREATRLYAKAVKSGKPVGYDLSSEEKQAIKGAKKVG
ncbi:hypothetical protein COU96_03125 [Candidatus Shapirobacteria bacterium CG10_big_fil_rev_8_21_14_0_10_38_14]|uniref:DUF4446 domain-containing protein n=1 Tax=Candidatus Shapirobacteria bacterium CG10_big_fil_rev_8_21_14_0_10_38_14 TaxID=1974483 RepID=A0A2M8L4R4_9BACT|nr:MAG: hypothetical protein COU96_03125 [Candidatus Shapirobacteria bacterium CG10_big_fil_rev_8_21_14_0_10_38_14]